RAGGRRIGAHDHDPWRGKRRAGHRAVRRRSDSRHRRRVGGARPRRLNYVAFPGVVQQSIPAFPGSLTKIGTVEQSGTLILADLPDYARNNPLYEGPWLVNGWLPVTIQIVAALVLVVGIGRRSVGWFRIWLPIAAVVGAATGWLAHWYVTAQGL